MNPALTPCEIPVSLAGKQPCCIVACKSIAIGLSPTPALQRMQVGCSVPPPPGILAATLPSWCHWKIGFFPSSIFSPNPTIMTPVDVGSWSRGGTASTRGLVSVAKVRAKVKSLPAPPPVPTMPPHSGPQAPLSFSAI